MVNTWYPHGKAGYVDIIFCYSIEDYAKLPNLKVQSFCLTADIFPVNASCDRLLMGTSFPACSTPRHLQSVISYWHINTEFLHHIILIPKNEGECK
jgi:hypothetical protein